MENRKLEVQLAEITEKKMTEGLTERDTTIRESQKESHNENFWETCASEIRARIKRTTNYFLGNLNYLLGVIAPQKVEEAQKHEPLVPLPTVENSKKELL